MNEVWKDLDEFPNHQISNLGRIKRLAVVGHRLSAMRHDKIKTNIFSDRNGWVIMLKDVKGRHLNLTIARLLLTVFVRPPKKGELARHLDDNKYNQTLDNLAWGSQKENMADARRNKRTAFGKRLPHTKLTDEQVDEIRRLYVPNLLRRPNRGYAPIARKYNVSGEQISLIIRGESRKNLLESERT